MRKSIERSHYQVTFMVLLLGVTAYSLLQSLVIPALPRFSTTSTRARPP